MCRLPNLLGSRVEFWPLLEETWRRIILGQGKSWVVFAHGTCVILMEPMEDLATQAVAQLREWGPVHVGAPAGDF